MISYDVASYIIVAINDAKLNWQLMKSVMYSFPASGITILMQIIFNVDELVFLSIFPSVDISSFPKSVELFVGHLSNLLMRD
jgi:hypothetical protein